MFMNAGPLVQKIFQAPSKTPGKFWIQGFGWDLFWIFPGIWLFPLILFLDDLDPIYAVGVFLFWIGHRVSSLYLGWFSPSFRPLLHDQRQRFIFIPLAVLLLTGFWLMLPESLLPLPFPLRILSLAMLDYFWGIYHFAAQHFGMLRLYRHLAPGSEDVFEKIRDRWYCLGAAGGLVIFAEVLHGTAILQEDWTGPILTSKVFGGQQQQLLQFGLILSLCWFLFMLQREFRSGGSLPRLLYLLQLGVMVGAAFVLDPFRFLVLWTLQHWMSAVGLVSFLGGNDISSRQTEGSSHSRILHIRSRVGVLILLCLVSLLMTPMMEIEALSADSAYSAQWWPGWWEWIQRQSWLPLVMVIGFSSGFIHYLMDR
ncbi:MAG: hypothetical protein VYC97_06660, partial [SAR324 cluster bacterium]|nr:hypothetical protein [SAR324 cluster bacterium]